MYTLEWTQKARETYERIRIAADRTETNRRAKGKRKSSKQEGLLKQIDSTLHLLETDPRYPSLCTHEYHSMTNPIDPNGKVFESYVQNRTPNAYRVFWHYGPGRKIITILLISGHP